MKTQDAKKSAFFLIALFCMKNAFVFCATYTLEPVRTHLIFSVNNAKGQER